MRKSILALLLLIHAAAGAQQTRAISLESLKDKIKGGWAGQTIGVSLGAPYEFRYNGSFIQDYVPLVWRKGYVKEIMINEPGIYDDLYMDLTFVDIFEKHGLDAHVDSFANAFAHAEYMLWHANQAARYNILNGIKAPHSGHWKNNPHADDIDYQIESDFAGLMSPGMPGTAADISDRIGHIMNYGDGWYGGVFVSTMYTLAFFSNDVNHIINESLKAIPANTRFHRCIADVVKWHRQYPDNWHMTWLEIQKKWTSEISCPDGIFHAFNIDATVNAAYVVLGMLYGKGDIGKSMEITTRAGQDADCNPSTVGGILGTMLGYSRIPAYWLQGFDGSEDINFKYTDISLNKAYELGTKHALLNIQKNGGRVSGTTVEVKTQPVKPVRWEQGFEGLTSVHEIKLNAYDTKLARFSFEGTGLVIKGNANRKKQDGPDKVLTVRVTIDGKQEIVRLPTSFQSRRHDVYWNYELPAQKHDVVVEWIDPDTGYTLNIPNAFYYQR